MQNVRRETVKTFRKENTEYLRDNEFEKVNEPRNNTAKDENGYLLTECPHIFNRRNNYFVRYSVCMGKLKGWQ
jgi:hypothetical protein